MRDDQPVQGVSDPCVDERQSAFDSVLAPVTMCTNPSARSTTGEGWAPSNIALVKYWGKRDPALHLPFAPSLSVSLGEFGVKTRLRPESSGHHVVWLNQERVGEGTAFFQRLQRYLNHVRVHTGCHYAVSIQSAVPVAAGLASSAAGFAALVCALDDLHGWQLSPVARGCLARLGSGSATRSLYPGFVEWPCGTEKTGEDSYGRPLNSGPYWYDLRVGIVCCGSGPKPYLSSWAMAHTCATAPWLEAWVHMTHADYTDMRVAISQDNFQALGLLAEHNAMSLHALMRSARPAVVYDQPATVEAQRAVWDLRSHKGVACYFTQDAGPHLKILYWAPQEDQIRNVFPQMQCFDPFVQVHTRGN